MTSRDLGLTNRYPRKLPDGTVIWTSPTGHTYTTYPGSNHLFPKLCEPTGTLWPMNRLLSSRPVTAA
jgi:hypothetical protein